MKLLMKEKKDSRLLVSDKLNLIWQGIEVMLHKLKIKRNIDIICTCGVFGTIRSNCDESILVYACLTVYVCDNMIICLYDYVSIYFFFNFNLSLCLWVYDSMCIIICICLYICMYMCLCGHVPCLYENDNVSFSLSF